MKLCVTCLFICKNPDTSQNANCLAFCEVYAFCILKIHATQSFMGFLYKCQLQTLHEKWREVKCLAFSIKNVMEIVLIFEKCLYFCI